LYVDFNPGQLFIAIVTTESIVNIKYGYEELSKANLYYIAQWVAIMIIGSFVGLTLNWLFGFNSCEETGDLLADDEEPTVRKIEGKKIE
jgi:hypothetical protein